jgi:large subunit ribosomal protein L20
MSRVKGGVTALKRRRSVLKQAKGYRFGRGTKERQATEALRHAGVHAFNHRRTKKREMRRLWTMRINAAVRPLGLNYSKFIAALKTKEIGLDRKILADLAENQPDVFKTIVEKATA